VADPERELIQGSPAIATLLVALGGALAGRVMAGGTALTRIARRAGSRRPDGTG
jgi:hypothetical protein